MAGFDAPAGARYPGGRLPTTGGPAVWSAVSDLVTEVVDDCGFQVMVDVAYRYPDPLSTWLVQTAISALGEIAALPEGLRCADLQAMGLGPKQAIDYWFLWGAPPLMDADSNGIPCETVWPDVARYLPSGYCSASASASSASSGRPSPRARAACAGSTRDSSRSNSAVPSMPMVSSSCTSACRRPATTCTDSATHARRCLTTRGRS